MNPFAIYAAITAVGSFLSALRKPDQPRLTEDEKTTEEMRNRATSFRLMRMQKQGASTATRSIINATGQSVTNPQGNDLSTGTFDSLKSMNTQTMNNTPTLSNPMASPPSTPEADLWGDMSEDEKLKRAYGG